MVYKAVNAIIIKRVEKEEDPKGIIPELKALFELVDKDPKVITLLYDVIPVMSKWLTQITVKYFENFDEKPENPFKYKELRLVVIKLMDAALNLKENAIRFNEDDPQNRVKLK